MRSITLSNTSAKFLILVATLGLATSALAAHQLPGRQRGKTLGPKAGWQRPNPRGTVARGQNMPVAGPRKNPTDPRLRNRPPYQPPVGPRTSPIVLPRFRETTTGRIYENGVVLRQGFGVPYPVLQSYFPAGVVYFPYYTPTYIRGVVSISPFAYFFGSCAPYLNPNYVYVQPPQTAYIDVPGFDGDSCTGFPTDADGNLIERTDIEDFAPGLPGAIDQLVLAFQDGNIDSLVSLINPQQSVAIFLKGNYRYSLPAHDFADLARDAIQATHTVGFRLDSLRQRTQTVFTASGTQTYRDAFGNTRTVFVSFVFQGSNGRWTLIQVGTAPDKIQPWQ